MNILELNLCNPLYYRKSNERAENGAEELFCFALNPSEAWSIAPQADKLVKEQIFHGFIATPDAKETEGMEMLIGHYLFAQMRGNAAQDDWLLIALEAQKYGLQKGFHLGNRLFVRILFEDGKKVTQMFRPYSSSIN
ncbi:MAG: hypothetical protein LBI40_02835 [Treponema sp.]|jgi:hypothetical protein|nr:hypothetical protein [Treponema sp.]